MTQDLPRAADIIARRLYQAGCRTAFGMPGGEVLTLVDALERAGIRFILTRHENAAGFMAEAVYHRDGAPGILVATVGPGLMNATNVIANAEQDRVPLIVLTGCIDADEAETYTHQVLDHRAVLAPITKATFRLTPGAAGVQTDKAIAIATEARPGPVLIDVPIAAADTRVADQPVERAPATALVPAPGADLDSARNWLASAQRPVMIAGLDVLTQDAAAPVAAFAKRFNIPVITTYKAKGVLPESHALALGGAGLSPKADKLLLPFIAQADLILCVGYDPIEMRTGWRMPWRPERQAVVDIAAAPNRHFMHQGSINFLTAIAPTLDALGHDITPRDTWPAGQVQQLRADLAAAFPRDQDWGPAAIIDTCGQVLPPDTLASADSGAHRILLSQMWRCETPRALIQSSGLCTMGCAVPMAIGTALAEPDRPVVAFTGDAGFLMVAGELASAAELGLRPIFVVFVDHSLALIELKQRQRQLANAGVDFAAPDFAAIGRAFGGAGHTVRSRGELDAALNTALAADTFSVIAAEFPRQAYDGAF